MVLIVLMFDGSQMCADMIPQNSSQTSVPHEIMFQAFSYMLI